MVPSSLPPAPQESALFPSSSAVPGDEEDPLLFQGAVVQKIHSHEQTLLLRVRVPGETALVVLSPRSSSPAGKRGAATTRLGETVGAVDLSTFRQSGFSATGAAGPSPWDRRKRELVGARLVGMFAEGVVLKKGDTVWELRCGPRELHWQALSPPETLGPPWRKSRRNEAFVLGKHLLASAALSSIDARRLSLKRALDKARGRVARRKDAILGDLERMREVQATAAQAQAFVAAAKGAPRGAKQLTITDWTSGEARERTFPLDPAKSAREQLEAVFRRAKRLRESAPLVETRLQATADSLAMLEHLAASLGQASTAEAFDAITQDARKAAPRDFAMALSLVAPGRAGKTSPRREARLPYRTFRGQDGDRILVGRGAADNDALTFHVGKPHDLWLHAKDQGGAHVIVPLAKGKVCPPALLVEAAHLAAHFSDKRDELLVDVQYTPKKFLRKPKGSAPGFVIVEREKVLVLRKDSQLLARLLAEEELP